MAFVLALVLCVLLSCVHAEETVHFWIPEGQPTRTNIGNIIQASNLSSTYAPEILAKLRFRFREPDPLFEIIETTGMIRTRRVIDREELDDCMYSTSCVMSQEVMVKPYTYFKIIPIEIRIDDVNDHAPQFPQSRLTLDISESVTVNTTFSIPTAEDPDSGVFGIYRYELITPTDTFGIKVNSLPDGSKDVRVIVLKSLDRENYDFYSIQIRAIDGGNPAKSGTVTVDISVVDSNDNSPVFDKELYEAQIYENLDIDTPVIQVHARDHDEGANGVVYYSFEPHTQANFGQFLGLHNGSGLIYVKGPIDYETHKSFHLTLVANDLGKNSVPDYTKVNIAIMDINDNAPEISVNTFTDNHVGRVPENVLPGHTIAYVGVSDPDSGRGGNVSCDIDNSNFRIQVRPNSGSVGFEIVSAKQFDREEQQDYIVVVRCEDHGSPQQTSSVRVSIRVTDANDNTPYFKPNSTLFAISVNENNKIGDIIIKMNTSDRDTMQNSAIRYSMEAIDDTPENAIAIDLITGVITAKVEFDFETRNFYQYRVIATDQGDPPRYAVTTLNLNIVDQNDGFPHFLKTSYSFSVLENQIANTDVGVITAVDNDSPPFDEIIYSLEPVRNSYKFHIDPNMGHIVTATILDREESAVYHLIAVAANRGSPQVKTTINVTVHINDENDNPPHMIFPTDTNNTVQVPTRMSIGYHVVQIEATDPDENINGELKFAISSGNEDGIFAIDSQTGAISAAASIEKGNGRKQTIILKVMDEGEPERRTFTRLTLVFNQSVPISGTGGGALLAQDTLVILIVAAIGGCVFIVIVIAMAICCVRRSRRAKDKKGHVYNCRTEEAKKALSGPDVRGSTSSEDSHGSDKSIDTGIGKTKDKAKKEVTFSVDMDDGWPMQNEKTVIENPHAQHIDPIDCHPPPYLPERARIPAFTMEEPQECPRNRPVTRQSSCCVCQKHAEHRPHPSLTQHNLEALEYNFWPNCADRDSESGCSGTDSGRGNSEEGECGHHGELSHSHDQCGHGTCCCSSGIHAKRYHGHLYPPTPGVYNNGQYHGASHRECNNCGPAHHHHHGHTCSEACDNHNVPKTSPTHNCSVDECTPLESLPPFSKPHFRDRFYSKLPRYSECPNSRAARQRLSLDSEEMAKNRQYGYAPSMPSLSDRHTPSPTFTSASDSQFYPYTGAHSNHRGNYPCANKTSTFMPITMKKSPSREDERSMTVSEDGTTTSGSYSMENVNPQETVAKVVAIDAPVADCYV